MNRALIARYPSVVRKADAHSGGVWYRSMHSTVNGESTPDIIFINFKLYADEVFIARGHKILPVIGGARTKPHANMEGTAWSKRERHRRVQDG